MNWNQFTRTHVVVYVNGNTYDRCTTCGERFSGTSALSYIFSINGETQGVLCVECGGSPVYKAWR